MDSYSNFAKKSLEIFGQNWASGRTLGAFSSKRLLGTAYTNLLLQTQTPLTGDMANKYDVKEIVEETPKNLVGKIEVPKDTIEYAMFQTGLGREDDEDDETENGNKDRNDAEKVKKGSNARSLKRKLSTEKDSQETETTDEEKNKVESKPAESKNENGDSESESDNLSNADSDFSGVASVLSSFDPSLEAEIEAIFENPRPLNASAVEKNESFDNEAYIKAGDGMPENIKGNKDQVDLPIKKRKKIHMTVYDK